jgi:hypothetical protein
MTLAQGGCGHLSVRTTPSARWRRAATAWPWAIFLVALSFILQGNVQINLADEGYLWYGAWRTAHGEVPLRDFVAYFPGRYYWAAACAAVFGQGIMGLRAAVALFQVIGLAFGLMALQRVVRSWRCLVPAALLLLVWMHPRHKLFEHSISLGAVYFALLLAEMPTLKRHVAAGVFAGLSVFFGLNHGLYCIASFALLTLLLWYKTDRRRLFKRFAALGVGILLGAAPVLFMLLFVPGFFDGVLNYLSLLMHAGSTNLPLPVPWPWRQVPLPGGFCEAVAAFSLGAFFLLLPVFYIFGGAGVLLSRCRRMPATPLLTAAVVVGAAWTHHAFARPDLPHLAQSIEPFLIGAMALPAVLKPRWGRLLARGGIACVAMMSLFLVAVQSPLYDKAVANPDRYLQVDVNGDRLWLRSHNARMIEAVAAADAALMAPSESLLIACHLPGLYPIIGRTSPLWDFYLVAVKDENKERRQIAALEDRQVGWLLLNDMAIDGRDDLRFKNSHPLLWQYFMDNFDPVPFEPLPPSYWFMRRRE